MKKTDQNYCGVKGIIPPPHSAFFNASCKKHDEGYQKGGDDLRRLECDVMFYIHMLRDIRRKKGLKRCYYRVWAWLYYAFVRALGWTRFNYQNKKGETK